MSKSKNNNAAEYRDPILYKLRMKALSAQANRIAQESDGKAGWEGYREVKHQQRKK